MITDKTLCKIFENNLLLFIDRELPVNSFKELNLHVHECKDCSRLLNDTIDIIYTGKNIQMDLEDELWEKMIAKSVHKGRRNYSFNEIILGDKKEKSIFYWKIAFASVLVFASITISLLTSRANPVKQVSRELLDWEGSRIEAELNTVNQSIDQLYKEDWNTKVNEIDQGLDRLEKQTDKFSFN